MTTCCPKKNLLTVFCAVVTTCLLSGCYIIPERPDDPNFAPIAPATPKPAPARAGSLYRTGYGLSLFDDLKARHVGDILTVKLVENTDASKSTSTNLGKKNATTIANPTILGSPIQFNAPKFIPLVSNKDNGLAASLNSDNAFTGSGSSTQKNQLSGEITVTVINALPNGNLMIRGEKWLHLTAGKEFIRISGIVRLADIDEDNTVLSTRIANARIEYSGTGQMADTNFNGWLARFFIHPIWPF